MPAKAYYLTVLFLMMLARRTTSNPSLVTSSEYMGELIDVLNNIGDTLAEHRTTESLDTIAGAVRGQQAALKSFIQDQQKALSETLQGHHNDMEKLLDSQVCSQEPNSTFNGVTGVTEQVEKLAQDAEDRAKQIELLSQRFESTKQEIDEEINQKMEQLQTLKGETRLDLDQVRSAMEDELKTLARHTDEAILHLQKDLNESRQQVNEVKLVVNGQLFDSVNKSLNEEMAISKIQFLERLEELEYQTTTAHAAIMEDVKQTFNNISIHQKTSMDSIKSVEEKASADIFEVKTQILAANSKLKEIEGELGSMQLDAKINADKTATLKKLQEGTTLVQETVEQLRQNLTSYRTTTQQTISSFDARVAEVSQNMVNALENITSELKGTKDLCINQTTQNKDDARQAVQNLRNNSEQLEAEINEVRVELGSRVDSVQELLEWTRKNLDDEMKTTKNQHGRRLDQLQVEIALFATNLKREVKHLQSKTQETAYQMSSKVEEVNKGLASAVTKMKADVEGTKHSCAEQASKSESQVKQTTNQIQSDLKLHEAEFYQFKKEVNDRLAALVGQVDAAEARTRTHLKTAEEQVHSFKQSLRSDLSRTNERLRDLQQKVSEKEKKRKISTQQIKQSG